LTKHQKEPSYEATIHSVTLRYAEAEYHSPGLCIYVTI